MTSSAEISRAMYEQLGADGLASRTSDPWDLATVRRIQSLLPPAQRVADLGCGYGRIAVPLAAAGHDVWGLDISAMMLDEARRRAGGAGVEIRWQQGDLCELPCDDGSFDAVLCLWLTFNELYQRHEQLAALREMCRVLRPGGVALLDGPPFGDSAGDRGLMEKECGAELPSDGISRRWSVAAGSSVADAYAELLQQAGAARHQLLVDDCPGRPRHFLKFWTADERSGVD